MKAKANTTSEQSNEKSMEVGDPRMAEMEEQEKKIKKKYFIIKNSHGILKDINNLITGHLSNRFE